MSFFSRVFRGKESSAAKKQAKQNGLDKAAPKKPQWTDAWTRTEVGPEEVSELLRGCTQELKSRALDIPFLLLPFRPSSDPSAARTFVRHYFSPTPDRTTPLRGEHLLQELRLTEPMVLCSVMKWCWSRLPGGVVTWEAYELFKVGEQDSQLARDAFSTFIPLSVESDARTKIIFDFFDLLAAVAAHGKTNGLGGRKLSRYAGWWAFEHTDTGNGFESGYKNWASAADATSHLFFAYLRSLSPDSLRGANGISALPISLQSLVQATEYPPEPPSLLQIGSTKVIMIVDTVSPTPFALLRRAKNFQYRDSDHALQEFSNYEDPVRALTDECRRVLRCISSTNQSNVSSSKASTSLRDASWSRFEDIGFGGTIDESDTEENSDGNAHAQNNAPTGLRSAPHSRSPDLGRPTTPSWADFLSSGFTDENGVRNPAPLLLPPDKVLPPITTARGQSSQSHRRMGDNESTLEPGELASITTLDLDDSFWWVWLTSLAGEEPILRKAAFGRCALVETVITGGRWLVMEEQVKGAAPEPEAGAYIAEKKSFFGFTTRRGKLTRRKSSTKKIKGVEEPYKKGVAPSSKTSIGPDQHARIQAAAAALQRKHKEQEREEEFRRNGPGADDTVSNKTNSVLTLQPHIVNEASPAMKWANNYDKHTVRAAYLSNSLAGTGAPAEKLTNGQAQKASGERDLPATPTDGIKTKDHALSPTAPPLPTAPKTQNTENEKKAAIDAAKVPLPAPTPVKPTEKEKATPAVTELKDDKTAEPKQSLDSTEDSGGKKLKKKAGNSGLKGIFGKKKTEQPPMKPTGADTSAVAAARAALEGRTAQVAQESSTSLKPSGSNRLSGFRRKPVQDSSAAESTSSKPATPPKAEAPKPVVAAPVAPAAAPAPAPAPAPTPTPVSPIAQYDGPPQTRRGQEEDELSRVNTAERQHADREFSSFDQGPLVEQPAFVPDDTPTAETFLEKTQAPPLSDHPATRQAENPANGNDANGSTPAADEPVVPIQDRWAQIRKNAAERANQEEPQPRTSQAERTDDGETSGEETIESRVARIKARVAELTGNMEAQ